MHVLEAGHEVSGRPCILLLHGFPELAYSWRKVMLPLAAAGFHVIAPDQRGYGRTTGWDSNYDGDLNSFRILNVVKDALALVFALGHRSVAAVVGHDFGSPVAAYCALARPDVFRSVAMMSAPFAGPPVLPFSAAEGRSNASTAPLQDSRRPRGARPAAQALSLVLFDARSRRQHAQCPARHSRFPARLLPPQERGLETEPAVPAQGMERRRTGQAADLLRHGSRQGHGRDGGGRDAVRIRDRRVPVADRRRTARLQRGIRPHRIPGRPAMVSMPDGRGAQRRPRSCSPAARSTCRHASSRARATGASTRSPAISSRCRQPPARKCWAVIWSMAPGTGCSRSSPSGWPNCFWSLSGKPRNRGLAPIRRKRL